MHKSRARDGQAWDTNGDCGHVADCRTNKSCALRPATEQRNDDKSLCCAVDHCRVALPAARGGSSR